MASLAGVGIGGTVGGIVGALVGMGIPEYEAKRYEGAVKDGGTLLSVPCDTSEQIDAAKDALKETELVILLPPARRVQRRRLQVGEELSAISLMALDPRPHVMTRSSMATKG
jgi:hypothetical protein